MKTWPVKNNVREARFAGKFYPENAKDLKEILKGYFAGCKPENSGNANFDSGNRQLRALISPHAGYVFSGQVAACSFAQIPDNKTYKHVFVLASSHSYSFKGAAVYASGNYKTPLGEIIVDTNLAKQLVKTSEYFFEHGEAHGNEHSLEVQLPFLQYKLGTGFLLVPIILGTHDPEICKKIAQVLKPWFSADNLFVISTDFSHYPEYNNANKVDDLTAAAICENQPEKLLSVIKENKKLEISNLATSLCGWTSVLTLLYLTRGSGFQYKKISYRNSGDAKIYKEKDRVVGYWAIAVFEENQLFNVEEEEKAEILEKAKNAIYTFVKTGKKGELIKPHSKGILNEITGVFVSVYINDKLRGCIGGFALSQTLNDLVQKMAVSASCDGRFPSIQPDELQNMELEISVLSPLKEITSKEEIQLGKHGIYIRKGLNSGTFLPQVSAKTGWNVDQFLGHCSRDKAGIGWDGWKTAELFTYEAIIFRGK